MPHDVLIVTEAELRRAVPLDLAAVDTVERAFLALHEGGVVMPPVLSMALPAAARSTSRPPGFPASTASRSRSAPASSTTPSSASRASTA